MGNMYVQIAIEINRKQTAKRKAIHKEAQEQSAT